MLRYVDVILLYSKTSRWCCRWIEGGYLYRHLTDCHHGWWVHRPHDYQ